MNEPSKIQILENYTNAAGDKFWYGEILYRQNTGQYTRADALIGHLAIGSLDQIEWKSLDDENED